MIQIKDGNILEQDLFVLAHVVNCQAVMGSGVALGIKQQYPKAFVDYIEFAHKTPASQRMGQVNFSAQQNGGAMYIANMHAQFNYGYGQRHLNYEAFYKCLEQIRDFCKKNENVADVAKYGIGFPYKIGSDRAGGDWEIVAKMIERVFFECEYPVIFWRLK
jgi:O-acetyl-ADP-ribose deacetylase (regulator of RNase III)